MDLRLRSCLNAKSWASILKQGSGHLTKSGIDHSIPLPGQVLLQPIEGCVAEKGNSFLPLCLEQGI